MDENGQVRYLGKSSGYYLLQNSRTYQNGAFHFANYGNRPRHQKTSRSKTIDPLELPPKDLSEHLIRLYFKHFYPFLPLFYKRQLYSTVDSPITESVTPLLLNAIYAIASRISPDARVRSDPKASDTAGNIFFERAEKLLDESYDTPSISTVQALLLLASHQHGIMKSARAWLYSGMAFRMAQDLGLHRNCDHWNIPPEECERRKRVFWCCYIVDRLSSAMYGRASTFEERDCDVPFPSVDDDALIEDDGEPDESKRPSASVRLLESFTNLIKICDILGHVLKNIYYVRSLQYAGIRQVDNVLTTWNKKLRQWYDQLPDSLQIKKENNHQAMPSTTVCQLHMIYHTTMILLHRPFIPGPNQSLIPTMLPCASICSAAADAVLSITDSMLAENKLRYVMNYSVYYIFTSGTIFIGTACPRKKDDPALLSSDNKSLEAKLKLRQCMLALDEIEGTWITASKSCQILAELSGFRDIDFQVSEQQEQYNHGLWQTTKPTPQIHFQHHVDSSSSHSSVFKSPQSSRTASPQPYHEPSHRTNNSNLRFPIVRIDPKNGQEDVASSNRRAHSNPQIEFSSSHSFQAQSHGAINNTTTNDPFAAQGVVSLALPRHYDPLGNTFWNMASSSLDDWNNFMNSNINNTPPFVSEQERQPFETANNVVDDYVQGQEKQRLIHTDQNVDMLSGVSVPLEESSPQNYLQHLNEKKTTASMDGRPSVSDLANAYYW
ncbi:fungal-specific transcription factor domain-containing protein [Gilbertella persicaria]|uniref:fungal-specific transcription factor domain-containing protein n=1 Tax=Gilbertella persicaria TaxID=101096 RepID=UPI00221F1A3C|nr:fungal-specific transcription factor domain-containing protein [Gilbertella persicaria]KAI8097934.1 fungal-specific transcription factor domain-containing protein [Gilbertella persicaria]